MNKQDFLDLLAKTSYTISMEISKIKGRMKQKEIDYYDAQLSLIKFFEKQIEANYKNVSDKYYLKMRSVSKKRDGFGGGIDQERMHIEADDVLCECLAELGCSKLVKIYEKIPKWYA